MEGELLLLLVVMVTMFVPSLTSCLDSSPGGWTSQLVMVCSGAGGKPWWLSKEDVHVVDEGVHDAHGLVLEMVVSEVDLLVDEVGLLVELLASLPSY